MERSPGPRWHVELPPVGAVASWAMSEKRHRTQQRRARRRANRAGRPSPSPRRSGSRGVRRLDAELAELLSELAGIAAECADDPSDALEAEQWASGLLGTFARGPLADADAGRLLGQGLVDALERLGNAGALAALRAIGALEAHAASVPARAAADRLAGAGTAEPAWAGDLGFARPLAAELICDPTFDDGVSVLIEFSGPGASSHTVGVYIDHNMGGLVKDAFVAGPLSEVRATLAASAGEEAGLAMHELDLGEARARVEQALELLDRTLGPPVDDDVHSLRALVEARVRLLPAGAALPVEFVDVTPKEREDLLEAFVASREGERWLDDDDALDVAAAAIDFGADYNHGGPLRWSPVVVEVFMTSWLARKVGREREFFERVPAVLADWVAFAARRRGISPAAAREAVAAVELCRDEMLETVDDPRAWGPAKAFGMAALRAGVDLSDPSAVEAFVERYNDGLAA